MSEFIQKSFVGGMNQQIDGAKLLDNEYQLLVNGRTRYDSVVPVKLPLELNTSSGLPKGKMQGCYAAGSFLLVFVGGYAYVKNYESSDSSFQLINNFQMSATADRLYASLVPGSIINYARKSTGTGVASGAITLDGLVQGSPAGIIVQDGLNQPMIIFADGSTRACGTYGSWTTTDREYVPIGRQMLFSGSILYLVSKDGKAIYRSVSGRPLDFMVNVTATGDKLDSEVEGGAATVSHAVSFEEITALSTLPTNDGSFFVASKKNSFIVTPNYDRLIFGEPTFSNTYLFPTGAMNNFCFVDILGDSAFIDFTGIRSFNAVLQLKNEGRNSSFSSRIYPLFKDIVQSICCAVNYDNYALFAVDTIYGPAIVVFDTITKSYVGLDIYPNVGSIKQFCEVQTEGNRHLFFISTDDKLYEAFSGETAECSLYAGEWWCSNNPQFDQRPLRLRLQFNDVHEAGIVSATVYTDRKISPTGELRSSNNPLVATSSVNSSTVTPPYTSASDKDAQSVTFDVGRSSQGWKIGAWIQWSVDASLTHISLTTEDINGEASYSEQARIRQSIINKS